MPDGSSPAVRRRAGAVLALPVALVVAACGAGEPRTAPPSGIDGLRIPTPSPDPADFGPRVDNPWFPLAPGSRWTYQADDGRRVEVTVASAPRVVAGVESTVVDTVERGPRGRVVERSSAWYAQDLDGNVWHLGDAGSWEAAESGARAGLVMPATPRVGDGFVQEQAPGVAEDASRVLEVDAQRTTAYDSFDSLVHIEETSPLDPTRVEQAFYARGVGLVLEETTASDLVLVEYSRG